MERFSSIVDKCTGYLPIGDEMRRMVSHEVQDKFEHAGEKCKIPLNRCKILIVGDEGVGKTSLRKHSMGENINKDHKPTVGIETFEVETFELESNWQKRTQTHDDFDRGAAWWVVSNSNKKPKKKGYAQSSKIFSFLIHCFLLFFQAVILQDGFTRGFFIYFMIMLLIFTLIFGGDFNSSLDTTSSSLIYMVLFDTVLKKHTVDYEMWRNGLSGLLHLWLIYVLSFMVAFSKGFFGKNGFVFMFCVMIAPTEVNSVREMFAIQLSTMLDLDYHFCVQVVFFYVGSIVGGKLTYFLMYRVMKFQESVLLHSPMERIFEKFPLPGALILLILSLVMQSFSVHAGLLSALELFVFGIPLGCALYVGVKMGPKLKPFKPDWGVYINMGAGTLAGFLFAHLLGWRLHQIWKIGFTVPFLFAYAYANFKLYKCAKQKGFPVSEFTKAYRASNAGSKDLPIVFSLMDFAGQGNYYEMHHTFMVDTAVYLIAFNLRNAITNIDAQYQRILFWLNKIRLHAQLEKRPSVFLVGTHRYSLMDFTEADSLVQKISLEITRRIQSSRIFRNMFVFNEQNETILFSVENASNFKTDNGLLQLKAHIQHTAQTNCGHEQYQLKWLLIVRVCQELASQGLKLVKRNDLLNYFQRNFSRSGSFDATDFQNSLIRANHAGYIIYRDITYLTEYVVTDQFFLISIMKKFLEPSPSWALCVAADWDALQREGIASMNLMSVVIQLAKEECQQNSISSFQSFWNTLFSSDAKYSTDELQVIIGYLKEIDFLHECAILSLPKSTEDRHFLIPSKLPVLSDPLPATDNSLELYIHCEDAPLMDIFPRLVARSLNKCPDVHRQMLHRSKLSHNIVTIHDAEIGPFQLEAKMDVPEQQLLCIRTWPSQKYDALQIFVRILNHVDVIVKRCFPYLQYMVGVRCINPNCCEMRESKYMHILPLPWNLGESEGKEMVSLNNLTQHHIVFCGTKHYRVTIDNRHISVEEMTVADIHKSNHVRGKPVCHKEQGTVACKIANILVSTSLSEWKNVARTLGVMESDIEAIEYDYCRDLKEQCRQGIWIWWAECALAEEDRIRSLLDTLKELSLQSAIDSILEAFPDVYNGSRKRKSTVEVE